MPAMFLTTGEVGLAAAALTATAGLGGAWIQSKRDDKRWDRERDRERERWIREDRSRWYVEKLKAYADFATKVEELRIAIINHTAGDGLKSDAVIAPAFHAAGLARMLANERTQEAIALVWNAVMSFSRHLIAELDSDDHREKNRDLRKALREYRLAVREEMGIAEENTEHHNGGTP